MRNNTTDLVCFSQYQLQKNIWYFIELCHLNNNSKESLTLYVKNKLVHATTFSPYPYKSEYNQNSIGCTLVNERSATDNFHGEMVALYFFETSGKLYNQAHDSLSCMESYTQLDNLFTVVESKVPIAEKTFMHINPKYAVSKRRVAVLKEGKIEIYSAIEKILEETTVKHNTSTRNSFFSIGGIKAIIPILYESVKHSTNNDFL